MRSFLVVLSCCALCVTAQSQTAPPLTQQTAPAPNPKTEKLTNADVIELSGLGFSDDVIIDKIYAAKGTDFDTSIAGLKALKTAKISDAVIRVMINPSRPPSQDSAPPISTSDNPPAQQAANSQLSNKPRVFFQSVSHGDNRNASRDQSMEMSKDFEQDCPSVQITINQQMADFTVSLNHIEVGAFVRDNQIQIADKNGDLLSKTKEGGSIRAGMKKACTLVLAEWAKKSK